MPHSKPSRTSLTSSLTRRSEAMLAFPESAGRRGQPHPVAAMDDAVGDDAAGDDAAAGLEDLAHLGVAVDDLLVARLEHAGEHLLDVFDERVDDVVVANA